MKPDIQAKLREQLELHGEHVRLKKECKAIGAEVIALEEAGKKRQAAALKKKMEKILLRMIEIEKRL